MKKKLYRGGGHAVDTNATMFFGLKDDKGDLYAVFSREEDLNAWLSKNSEDYELVEKK